MSKVVCPQCGGRLTLDSLYQYGILRKVKTDGTLCKRERRRDYGPMEFSYLICESCGWQATDGDFDIESGKICFSRGVDE